VREGDDDALPAADERGELRLRLAEAARGDGRPLRLERERLPARERVELGGALEVDGLEPVLLPDPAHLVGLPDEIGGAAERGDQRPLGRRLVVVVPGQLDAIGVGPALRGRIDDRVRHGMERALREGREGADALDLVAEELDAQRLASGRREDVDEPAAHGELAALVGTLDACVAGQRERFREAVDARLGADLQPDRLRPLALGRQPLRERGRGRTDEPA
jgi:hypothetical protein